MQSSRPFGSRVQNAQPPSGRPAVHTAWRALRSLCCYSPSKKEGRWAWLRPAASRCSMRGAHHGEGGALGVAGLDDPRAAGDFGGAMQDFRAAGVRTISRFRNAVDSEVVVPRGTPRLCAAFHHAAAGGAACGEDLVGTHCAHIDGAILRPTKQSRIEGELAIEIAGVELVPADMTGRHRCNQLRLLLVVRLEKQKHGPAGIGGDGEAADIRDVL